MAPNEDIATREHAAQILDNYTSGSFTERGFENVPLSLPFGQEVLSGDVRALTSFRLPIEGSPNSFGLRPPVPENRPNHVAWLAANGLSPEQIISFNTGSNGNHVAVVSHDDDGPEGLTVVGDRLLPADGQGEKLTADAVIVLGDVATRMGIVAANADNPIAVATVKGQEEQLATAIFNGGWHNLGAGVDLTLRQKMFELGLDGRVNVAVGPGAREGFEVRRTALVDRFNLRQALGGDPRLYKQAIDMASHEDPEKTYLELAHLAQIASGPLAVRGGVVGVDVCTLNGAHAGVLHSLRVDRTQGERTPSGEMAGGDRNMTMIVPRSIQRKVGE